MKLHSLPAEERAVRRFVEERWLPYHRELAATVEGHGLADDVDLVAEEVEFRLDREGDGDRRTWVAVDAEDGPVELADRDVELAGFVATDLDRSPSVFERPGRLVVADVFVRESFRRTGFGRDLLSRAAERARETGCSEVVLKVHVDNQHAIEFYESMGFETRWHSMAADVDDL